MHCWRTRLGALAPALATRAYVDDLSAYTTEHGGPADIATAWEVTCDFGEAFHLVLNPGQVCPLGHGP